MTEERRTSAKAFHKDVFIDQERKLRDRRRSDTALVSTINYADQGLKDVKIFKDSFSTLWEITSLWASGGVWSQGWNLKELTEGHHQEWSLRLNSTQHGKTHQVQTIEGCTDLQIFIDLLGGGAWPFLARALTCLVNSVNERDLSLLNSHSRCHS